jgi:hypothetical protein
MAANKILLIDTIYPDFIRSLPFDPHSTYDVELRKVLDRQFGTSDFFSRNLKALGWDAVDFIANYYELQLMWNKENKGSNIIDKFQPDVLFLQDLSVAWSADRRPAIVAAQVSCAFDDERAKQCDIIFTSLPTHVPRIEALGVKAQYLPLAFEPRVLEGFPHRERIHDVVFIGGVGNPSHWKAGMEVLEHVAREIPTFKWWGYGVATLPADSALRGRYQGQAWGRDMYDILLQSKICLNRHGEVAQGYANNMRMYEATGCGAMLLTDNALNLEGLFAGHEVVSYSNASEAVDFIKFYLVNIGWRENIASYGQARTLRDHTYAQRMKVVSETLKRMLEPSRCNECGFETTNADAMWSHACQQIEPYFSNENV